jgi:hypothetical protein
MTRICLRLPLDTPGTPGPRASAQDWPRPVAGAWVRARENAKSRIRARRGAEAWGRARKNAKTLVRARQLALGRVCLVEGTTGRGGSAPWILGVVSKKSLAVSGAVLLLFALLWLVPNPLTPCGRWRSGVNEVLGSFDHPPPIQDFGEDFATATELSRTRPPLCPAPRGVERMKAEDSIYYYLLFPEQAPPGSLPSPS